MTSSSPLKVVLAGNPNCGKTTLFNGLTGTHQKVGNWPGVTVEKKTGRYRTANGEVEVIDLPGIYSLEQDTFGLDEQVALEVLTQGDMDVIVNIVDASCLDRQLLLTHQLREFDRPLLVVVNMLDVAEANEMHVDLDQLSASLGLPVIGIVASKHRGIQNVKDGLLMAAHYEGVAVNGDLSVNERLSARLEAVRHWVSRSVRQTAHPITATERIDQIVLNRFLGIPIFLFAMYLLFTFAIHIGAIFVDFFDILLGAWLVDGTAHLLKALNAPDWLRVLLADGLGGGVQLVGTFIPVISGLYFGLAFLEGSGYIVRAAFVVDRLMQTIGLPGKSFVPLIVGFGCNVPAVMATRTLDKPSDRMITMAMSPFMSCGARLTVYALFAAAFFESQGQNVVFALYLLGVIMAVSTGWIFRKAFYAQAMSSSIMEMPAYHVPSLRNVVITTWYRLKSFVSRAGKTILIVVVLLSFLNSWGTDGSFGHENSQQSMLSALSRQGTPLFSPMGIEADNWPATVGIITGVFAKEAVVGTLDSLYSDIAGQGVLGSEPLPLWQATQAALVSISDNVLALADSLFQGLSVSAIQQTIIDEEVIALSDGVSTYRMMNALFVTPLAALSYMVFILLYTPCVAVVGALVKEAGIRWTWVIVTWNTCLAYGVATIIYQLGSIKSHPVSSIVWVLSMVLLIGCILWFLKVTGRPRADFIPRNRIPIKNLTP